MPIGEAGVNGEIQRAFATPIACFQFPGSEAVPVNVTVTGKAAG